MATDIQTKIETARRRGYSDEQIRTFLKSKGMDPSVVVTPTVMDKINNVADTVTDFTGFRGVADKIGATIAKVSDVAPGWQERSQYIRQNEPSTLETTASGVMGGLGVLTPELKAAGTLIKGVGAKALAPVTGVTNKIGNAVKGTGEVLYSQAITPTVKEAERTLRERIATPFMERVSTTLETGTPSQALNRSKTAFQFGLKGRGQDIAVGAGRAAKDLWENGIQKALDGTKDVITKDELFSLAKKKVAETVEPGRKAALQDALQALEQDYASVSQYALKDAQKVKSELDQFTSTKLFNGKEVASEYQTLKHELADAIRQKIYTSLKDKGIKQQYLHYANLKELEKLGVGVLTEAKKRGGAGSFIMSMLDDVLTPAQTIGGRFIYRVGDSIVFSSPTKVTSLRQYLNQNGLSDEGIAKAATALTALTASGLKSAVDSKDDVKEKKTK